jgi:protein-L-isoaspartate(D-aspartate) O-methyltransferase
VSDLAVERLRFAEQLRDDNGLRSSDLVRAFATVAREQFVGPGPWLTLPDGGGYRSTPDADPLHLYRDVAVAIDAARLLNNGSPGLLARLIDLLEIGAGQTVAHLGCGTGYYAAVLGEMVGRKGRVIAVELDPELHARARKALRRSKQVELRHADATEEPKEPVDAILVSAGATHPQSCWLDALRSGGRLAVPLTAIRPRTRVRRVIRDNAGRVLHLERRGERFAARFGEIVAIHPLVGGRDPGLQRRLRVRSLRRDGHEPEPECWLHGDAFCLSRREPEP